MHILGSFLFVTYAWSWIVRAFFIFFFLGGVLAKIQQVEFVRLTFIFQGFLGKGLGSQDGMTNLSVTLRSKDGVPGLALGQLRSRKEPRDPVVGRCFIGMRHIS